MKLRAVEREDGSVELWVGNTRQAVFPPGKSANFDAVQAAKAQARHRKVPLLLEAVGDDTYWFRVHPSGLVEQLEASAELESPEPPRQDGPLVVSGGSDQVLAGPLWTPPVSPSGGSGPVLDWQPSSKRRGLSVRQVALALLVVFVVLGVAATVVLGLKPGSGASGDTPLGEVSQSVAGAGDQSLFVSVVAVGGDVKVSVTRPGGVLEPQGWGVRVNGKPALVEASGGHLVAVGPSPTGLAVWEVSSPVGIVVSGEVEVREND